MSFTIVSLQHQDNKTCRVSLDQSYQFSSEDVDREILVSRNSSTSIHKYEHLNP